MVRQSSQTTTLETGNKISDNNYSAGQVKTLPSDCCFKENGLFAIVPNELLTDDNAVDFIPKEKHLRRKLAIEKVRIDESITVICQGGEKHEIVRLIRQSLSESKANIAMTVDGKKMLAAAAEKGKLLFANSFEVNSDEDMLYYLLAICEHLEFSTSQAIVQATSAAPELIRRYFEVRQCE